jgi:hypothetical protein
MSDKRGGTGTKRATKRSDPKALARFVEELSWLLSSYADLDFRSLGLLSAELVDVNRNRNFLAHSGRRPTVRMLVGILPSVLIDEKLFATNEDIVEFAQSTLEMSIPRWGKKSRYELIGHVVCHTDQAPPGKLDALLAALDRLADEKGTARALVEKQRQSGASWNEVIQTLIVSNRDRN